MPTHERRSKTLLTWQAVCIFSTATFVSPAYLSNEFVASCEERYSNEGDEECESRADVPPVEDDAKVCCVPRKEHLVRRLVSKAGVLGGKVIVHSYYTLLACPCRHDPYLHGPCRLGPF